MSAPRMAILLVALALASSPRQADGYFDCCHARSTPPSLAGWWFRLPSQRATDDVLDRLGFVWMDASPYEGTPRQVAVGCSALSWLGDSWGDGLGLSAELGAPRFGRSVYCADQPAPGPPARRADHGHPNGAVELIRVIASSSNLDSACQVVAHQPGSWALSGQSLYFGRAFLVEGRRVREADLDYGGTLRIIETKPGDPLSVGASGWLGFTVRVRDLETTAWVLEDRGVRFSRVDTEEGPMIRVAREDGGGTMVEFVGER